MGFPEQRPLNGDLDYGLTDGRERKDAPNWGGQRDSDSDWEQNWAAFHGGSPVQGRR